MSIDVTTRASRFHLRPRHGWVNDPNGLVEVDGRWHVFYQHNPAGPVHDQIHWGHASSTDLISWQEHPVAFGPTPGGPDSMGCWSGVFVPGLSRPAVAYSGVTDPTFRSTICLRYGSADLDTWEDPLVVGTTPEADRIAVMRDPFVFRWRDRRWAVLGAGLDDGAPAVLLFSCDDIEEWHYEGLLLADDTARNLRRALTADPFECPQLVWLGDTPVLVVSLQHRGVLGDVVAIPGRIEDADGRPVFCGGEAQLLDRGSAFYAPQVLAGDREPLMLGWVREGDLPQSEVVAGCLTLPRRLRLQDGQVRAHPDPAVRALPTKPAVDVTSGVLDLPDHCVLEARSGVHWVLELRAAQAMHAEENADTGHVVLEAHTPSELSASFGDGGIVFVDGDVIEVYAPRDVPITLRGNGSGWQVRVPDGAHGSLEEVMTPSP